MTLPHWRALGERALRRYELGVTPRNKATGTWENGESPARENACVWAEGRVCRSRQPAYVVGCITEALFALAKGSGNAYLLTCCKDSKKSFRGRTQFANGGGGG